MFTGVNSNIHASILYSTPERESLYPNTQQIKFSMPTLFGCPPASGRILQFASHYAKVIILTHNPLQLCHYVACLT